MAVQTYTITSASFEAEAGDNISAGANPTVTLVIEPAEGYAISSGNFSIGNPLPSEVASAVFSQDGANVNCLITFDVGFVMPSADVELLIDIDGTANLTQYTIDGEYTVTQTNTQEAATSPVAFSQSGDTGEQITLFTKTFTATSGYYYQTPPYYYQTQGAQRADDLYEITYADNSLGGKITGRSYTVKYTVGEENKTLNDLNFVANAVEIYTDPVEVVGYSISLAKFQAAGTNREITFLGTPGAQVTFATTEPYPVDSYVSDNNDQTLTIGDDGQAKMTIIVPTNTTGSNQTWTFTLSGADLASPFSQTNPFSIIQLP